MFMNVVVGCVLIFITTCLHAAAMVLVVRGCRLAHAEDWAGKSHFTKAITVSILVLVLFLAGLIGAGVWAGAYLALGTFSGFEEAAYFSVVTYTTLGFGDVTIEGSRRLLAGLQAANGIIIFGWTTAIIVTAVQRLYIQPHKSES